VKHDVVGLGGLWIGRWMKGRASAVFHVKRGLVEFSTAVAHRVWIVVGAYEFGGGVGSRCSRWRGGSRRSVQRSSANRQTSPGCGLRQLSGGFEGEPVSSLGAARLIERWLCAPIDSRRWLTHGVG
jgi:hypothetical protein